MVCFNPMKAYHSATVNAETGKRPLTFAGHRQWAPMEGALQTLPCGECAGCRAERAEGWGIRCTHEAQMHALGSGGRGAEFWTLTYDNEHLPLDNSIHKVVVSKFMRKFRKWFRKHVSADKEVKFKFLGVGEYGDRKGRAHFHILVFGHAFSDRRIWKHENNYKVWISETLTELWGNGFVTMCDVNYNTATYCAAYSQKKVRGKRAVRAYRRRSPVDGKWYEVEPEFMLTSKGIGESWFKKYKESVFPHDYVVINHKKKKPPRYYEKMLSEAELEEVKKARREKARLKEADRTPARLAVREQLFHANRLRSERRVD